MLRDRLPKDIASEDGRYDVVSIGPWEAPIWASRGWLTRLDVPAGQGDYDVQDFIPVLRTALSYRGGLYAVPYYGESSFLMYRKDLFAKAGLTMPERPTWPQVANWRPRSTIPGTAPLESACEGVPTGWICCLSTQ